MPRTIAIGDIHGCADEFQELLDLLKLQSGDRVIQLGDLVNRGPDSHRVIKLARKYNIESILGNHELRLLQFHKSKNVSILKDYDKSTIDQLTTADWSYLKSLPNYKYDGLRDTVFVHGGFLPNQPWIEQSVDIITTIQVIDQNGKPAKRSDAPDAKSWADYWTQAPFVVYGHTPRAEVAYHPCAIGIDTGCVYGGHLTAYILDDKSIVQVRAKKSYAHSKRLPDPV
jgi:hypothetical protein